GRRRSKPAPVPRVPAEQHPGFGAGQIHQPADPAHSMVRRLISSREATAASLLPSPGLGDEALLDQALEGLALLEKAVKAGGQERTQMHRRLDRLERQLGVLLAAHTENRIDLAGTQHCEHQGLARRTRTLIEQNTYAFVRRYAERCDLV
ncbi:hypothetical protein ACFC5Z_32185, partial [Streptomyces sp. NPDC056004]|uniref:hypothetical protein n=1 Tax=Streptomyces sp. NPDC056004 TaxID=3345677 RepID=UPI0035E0B642